MGTQKIVCVIAFNLKGSGSRRYILHLILGAYIFECSGLFLGRRYLRNGAQASFREEVDLVIRQVQQNVKDYWCELQQIKRLSDSCSGHTQTFGQVRLGGTIALLENVFENECLFHRIGSRSACFSGRRNWLGVRGFNRRYEKLTVVQSRKVNPEGQIEKVRKSFGPGEPAAIYELCGFVIRGYRSRRGSTCDGFGVSVPPR